LNAKISLSKRVQRFLLIYREDFFSFKLKAKYQALEILVFCFQQNIFEVKVLVQLMQNKASRI
jgi:hypothetical protein